MNQLSYYQINRYEINNRILVDEINKANEKQQQRLEFVKKNSVFQK